MGVRDWIAASNFGNYSTLDRGHNWEDLRTQLRTLNKRAISIRWLNLDVSNFDLKFPMFQLAFFFFLFLMRCDFENKDVTNRRWENKEKPPASLNLKGPRVIYMR